MKFPSALVATLILPVACAADHDASTPIYKDAKASIDDRVADLISRMTIADKTAQLIQGDISNWINTTDDAFNATGLAWNMATRGGQFYVGYPVDQQWVAQGVKQAQEYLLHNTTLGIPAFVQAEGIHGFVIGNATIFNSPIAYACSWNPSLVEKMGSVIAQEALALGVNQIFGPLGDLARELRYGRVEETFGEDSYLAGEIGYSYVKGTVFNHRCLTRVNIFGKVCRLEMSVLQSSTLQLTHPLSRDLILDRYTVGRESYALHTFLLISALLLMLEHIR